MWHVSFRSGVSTLRTVTYLLTYQVAWLANTLLKDGDSARDSHVLACNFAKYLPILNFFHSQTQQYTSLNLVLDNPTTP